MWAFFSLKFVRKKASKSPFFRDLMSKLSLETIEKWSFCINALKRMFK